MRKLLLVISALLILTIIFFLGGYVLYKTPVCKDGELAGETLNVPGPNFFHKLYGIDPTKGCVRK